MYTKICIICNNTFTTNTWNKSVCSNDHYHPCPVCGKDVLCNDPKRQTCTCSRECGSVIRKQTIKLKYGVDNVSQLPGVSDKISEAQKIRHPKQPDKYKTCEVCGTKFKLIWPYTQHTCSSKCRGEYRKRSGISKSTYQKACATNMQRYGSANPGERPEIHKKMEDTMELRYGTRYARYLPEIEAKVRQTCLERYGVPYYIQTEDANRNNIYRISKLNKDFSEFLSSNGISDVKFEMYVEGKFYDLEVFNSILIEIDPTYTHNSFGNHWDSNGLDPNYHLTKTKLASDNGYRCIHVFDWDNWNDILSMITPKTSIYARTCEIRLVSKSDTNEFTAQFHIQGSCKGQEICYGLYRDNQLMQLMTFGKPRYNNKYNFELLRLCTRSGYRIIGGASKLFKHFRLDHPNDSVISYCDLAKFHGDVYNTIGMRLAYVTEPNKIWSKDTKKITQNLLNQRGYDQLFGTNYGKGTSNEQLMLDNGWLPVYDCGQAVYVYDILS